MKRILVVDTAASEGGALTVLQDFYKAVATSSMDLEWIFLVSGPYVEEKDNIRVIVNPSLKNHVNRLIFDYITGQYFVKKINPDIIFSLQDTVIRGTDVPRVLYLHQPVPFQSSYKFSFIKKNERYMAVVQYLLGWIIKCSIRRVNRVIVQTKWMKKAVISQCKIPEDNIVHIYPTVNKVNEENFCLYHVTNNFFYPTSNTYYKNIRTLLDACRMLDEEGLVYRLNITIDGVNTNKINYLGKISREEVYKNYQNSCLVFPSYIETFGYPLIEAKKHGAIILVSDCEFSHELLDDYPNVYFFDPFKTQELYSLMRKVISGNIKRKKCAAKKKVEDMNSWEEVIRVLRDVAKSK